MNYLRRREDRRNKKVVLAALLVFLAGILVMNFVFAGGRHHNDGGDTQTISTTNVYNNKNDTNIGQVVVATAVLACVGVPIWNAYVWPTIKAIFTLRKPVYKEGNFFCWEDQKPEPLPDPGPAVKNDVTPDLQPVGIKFK